MVRQCECADTLCPVHKGTSKCASEDGPVLLYRTDMDDRSGIVFCRACADDAMESGLFTDRWLTP